MRRACLVLLAAVLATACGSQEAPRALPDTPHVATFSIVAYDPDTQQWGVAVQSRVVSAGAIVPFAKAPVGAIATQALANVAYGPDGIALLAKGKSAEEVIETLTEADDLRDRRQLGIVDAKGNAATYTGKKCIPVAAGLTGKHYAVQGNMLANEDVVPAMSKAFEAAEGDLGDRMIAALRAGQKAGGDKRGRQAAGLLIVREGWGYGGGNDRFRDVRVDDHKTPIEELARVYALHKQVFRAPR